LAMRNLTKAVLYTRPKAKRITVSDTQNSMQIILLATGFARTTHAGKPLRAAAGVPQLRRALERRRHRKPLPNICPPKPHSPRTTPPRMLQCDTRPAARIPGKAPAGPVTC